MTKRRMYCPLLSDWKIILKLKKFKAVKHTFQCNFQVYNDKLQNSKEEENCQIKSYRESQKRASQKMAKGEINCQHKRNLNNEETEGRVQRESRVTTTENEGC